MSFSGPLPHPSILAEYDRFSPGIADRIVTMAEEQAAHRRHLEKVVIEGDSGRAWLGLCFGTLVALSAIGGGVAVILKGQPIVGLTAIVTQASAAAGVFVYAYRTRRKEREEKRARNLFQLEQP